MYDAAEPDIVGKLERYQCALAELGRLALNEQDIGRLMHEAARICATAMQAPYSKVCLPNDAANELRIVAGFGWRGDVIGHVVARAGISSAPWAAFSSGQPVQISNLRDALEPEPPPLFISHGIVASLDVAIRGQSGAIYGVLEVDCPFERSFDRHDTDFLLAFNSVLADAVDAAQRLARLSLSLARARARAQEKDVLAHEMHHRVRNNLHVLHTLLTSELAKPDSQARNDALAAVARRALTMAGVYDHLLGVGMVREIDFASYLTTLCAALPDTQTTAGRQVTLACDADPLMLDLDRVTVLGMVVAELIANSYRHAFPDRDGAISVALRHVPGSAEARMMVSDDGVGLPQAAGGTRHGLGLVRRLLQQAGGSVQARPGAGAAWLLRFPVAPPAQA